MEVVAATPPSTGAGVPPFHDHDVREWSRLDSLTGVLERARLETDHWAANTNKSCHQYNKVVDSRARTNADGALQQQARRQLEVFQSQVPGGQLQVIKTHTVSSSRWTNKNATNTTNGDLEPFENLQFPLNPLDLTSQKSKAIVARSVGRRPPTRTRQKEDPPPLHSPLTNPLRNPHITAATNLHRVSRLCHQIHENAVKQAFGKYTQRPSITERENGDGSVEIYEIENSSSEKTSSINGHTNLSRTKSTSSDDLFNSDKDKSTKSIEDLEDLEQLQNWRRTSKIRRSLQFPKVNNTNKTPSKPITDLPENKGSVRKIRDDLEKGRRLNTALRGNNVDLEALDQILQSISSSSSIYSDKTLDDNDEELEQISTAKKEKRNSFVTVETLQEIKGRLRRTSSPSSDIYKPSKLEDTDDGIVTEDQPKSQEMTTNNETAQSRVKSYVYGMEALLNKKPTLLGTGSLESRNKLSNISNNRSEDWYNRRKSYGFEQVHNGEDGTLKNKNQAESSTDSGICRSSEIVVVPTVAKKTEPEEFSSDLSDSDDRKYLDRVKENNLNTSNVKKISSLFDSNYGKESIWNKRSSNDWKDLKSTTITIPIKNNYWNDDPEKDIKRHSIAVDESKYVTKNNDHNNFINKRTSLALNDAFEDENSVINRKGKKVEFCKTEVHFAAESGKVNIVETDEKPPPTNNFRRRRRNSGPIEDFNRNGLPVLHFGDSSYEKSLFGIVDNQDGEPLKNNLGNEDVIYENLQNRNHQVPCGTVTVNTNINYNEFQEGSERKDYSNFSSESENIKGILKNKPIKPKPYHLGAPELSSFSQSDDESKRWGVKLKHISLEKPEPPIWKSTVTVQNTLYDNYNYNNESDEDNNNQQPEFQKLLKNLKPVALKKPDLLSSHHDQEQMENNNIRIVSPLKDNRRSSWSVADRIKLVEDNTQWTENKGYSTKVNIGNGEATVIENNSSYSDKNRHPTWPRKEEPSKDSYENVQDRLEPTTQKPRPPTTATQPERIEKFKYKIPKEKSSPIATRKTNPVSPPKTDLRTPQTTEKLHSPSLVGKNNTDYKEYQPSIERLNCPLKTEPTTTGKKSPTKEFKTVNDSILQNKYTHSNDIVLRQPKKSEMTYFGVSVSPKPTSKKNIQEAVIRKQENKLSDKPDLLQHHTHKKETAKVEKIRQPSPEGKKKSVKDAPIYENINVGKKNKYGREFDSTILDELTKAADQILQAVNGYTDEDSHNRLSTDDDEGKKHKQMKQLDTISETKSWKRDSNKTTPLKPSSAKTKLKPTSSTSSIESLSKEPRKVLSSTTRKTAQIKQISSSSSSSKKKTTTNENSNINNNSSSSSNNNIKANTKARRLQRASSREALLQSHGSSSEDLTANVEAPIRKPRLIKKTKSTQLTITNGLEMKKSPTSTTSRKEPKSSRTDERIPGALPEIRHKTAVSTIRSTAEKASRERSRDRTNKIRSSDDPRKRLHQKKEPSRGTSSSSRTERNRSVSSKETVTHRTSTANIKKCPRAEGATRH